MKLEINNKEAINIANNWIIGGKTLHVEVCQWFLRDFKQLGILTVVWITGEDNSNDLLTKTLPGPLIKKHTLVYCDVDDYTRKY